MQTNKTVLNKESAYLLIEINKTAQKLLHYTNDISSTQGCGKRVAETSTQILKFYGGFQIVRFFSFWDGSN